MVLNRLSPGCCCGERCGDCTGGPTPTEFDFTISGLSPSSEVSDECSSPDPCSSAGGSFTATGYAQRTATELAILGWNGLGFLLSPADVPSGALSACIWAYKNPNPGCEWFPTPANGFSCFSRARIVFEGYVLAKFKMESNYIWRLINVHSVLLSCGCYVWGGGDGNEQCCHDTDSSNTGWFWEYSTSDQSCTLSGSESWSLTTPTINLSVSCEDPDTTSSVTETMSFSDFCTGSLSLTANPTS